MPGNRFCLVVALCVVVQGLASTCVAQSLSWSPMQVLDTGTTFSDFPSLELGTLETDHAGHWIIGWNKYFSSVTATTNPISSKNVYISTSADDGISWSPPVLFDANTGTDRYATWGKLVHVGGGNWVAAIMRRTSNIPSRVFVSRSADNGSTWTVAQQVAVGSAGTTENLYMYDFDALGSTTLRLTTSATYNSVNEYRSTDSGVSWTLVQNLLTDYQQVAFSRTKWLKNTRNSNYLYASISSDGIYWTPDVLVATTPYFEGIRATFPVSLGNSKWLLEWSIIEVQNIGGPIFVDHGIGRATSTDDGQTWSAPVIQSPGYDLGSISANDHGGIVRVMKKTSPARLDYVYSLDYGSSFSTPQVVVAQQPWQTRLLRVSNSGTTILATTPYDQQTSQQVLLTRTVLPPGPVSAVNSWQRY